MNSTLFQRVFETFFTQSNSIPQQYPTSTEAKKKVIIAGSGFGGGCLALNLQNDFDVTVVDPRDSFDNVISFYRVLVEPSMLAINRTPFRNLFNTVDVKQAKLINVTKNSAKIQYQNGNEQDISFDYLVIATGGSIKSSFENTERVIDISSSDDLSSPSKLNHIQQATDICVIGGGPTGIEVAKELAECYPSKIIHLIHSKDKLMTEYQQEVARNYVEKQFSQQSNLNILRNSYATSIGNNGNIEGYNKLSRDVFRLPTSCAVLCSGFKPNTDFLQNPEMKHVLTQDGYVNVRSTLQLPGFDNIFAMGDVSNADTFKNAKNAAFQSKVVNQNIRAISNSGKSSSLSEYQPKASMTTIMMGRNDAVTINVPILGIQTGQAQAVRKQMISLKATVLNFFAKTLSL